MKSSHAVLLAAAVMVIACVAEARLDCNINLEEEGLPHCEQFCAMWCFATALATTRDFYFHNRSATCAQDECVMASLNTGRDCCNIPDMCDGNCAFGATRFTMLKLAKQMIPGMEWTMIDSAPSEEYLIKLLNMHTPVMRIMADSNESGHVDMVAGCRPSATNSSEIEYLVLDSLDPNDEWINYNDSVVVPWAKDPDFYWRHSIFSPSFVKRWLSSH